MKLYLFLISVLFMPYVLAGDGVDIFSESVNVGEQTSGGIGVNIVQPIFNFSTLNVTQADYWNTQSLGPLRDANDTQFDAITNVLNIDTSWLTSWGSGVWCALTGCTMQGEIDMDSNNITDVHILNFNESLCLNTDNLVEGDVCWNPDDYTLNIVTGLDSTVIQAGQEVVGIGINKEGQYLPDGTIVSMSNFNGDRPTFIRADSTNASKSAMIGVLTQNCEINAECLVTVFGTVRNINTSMFSSADKLYINASEPGNFTNIIPTLPNNPIWVATVNVVHENVGTIFVNPSIDPTDGFLINDIYANNNIDIMNNLSVGDYSYIGGDTFIEGRLFVGPIANTSLAATNPGDSVFRGNMIISDGAVNVFPNKYFASAQFFNNGDDDPGNTDFYLNFSGELNVSTEIFCDYLNDPFLENDTLNVIVPVFTTEFGTDNIYLAINSYINSSCVEVETGIFGDDNITELTNVAYIISLSPVFGVLDGGLVINGITMYYNTNSSSDQFGSYTRENTVQDRPGGNLFADAFTSILGDLEYVFGTQTGLNNSGSFVRNSFGVWSTRFYNITQKQDLNFLHNMRERWLDINITPSLSYDSNTGGADLAVEHGIESQKLFLHDDIGNGELFGEGEFTWIARNGTDIDLYEGYAVHIKKDVIKEFGFSAGDNITSLDADFDAGTLSPFVQTTGGGIGDWLVISDVLCHDGECARALGGSGSPLRSMQTNISSLDQDNLNLSWWITASQASPDSFTVDVNNNIGSGDVNVFSSSGNFVDELQTVILPSSMDNKSIVTVIFNFAGNNPSQDAVYVDDISVVGNATTTTLANVTVEDATIELGDSECGIELSAEDGYQDLNITCDNINLIGNINSLSGTYVGGSAYVCTTNDGTLFASEVACP